MECFDRVVKWTLLASLFGAACLPDSGRAYKIKWTLLASFFGAACLPASGCAYKIKWTLLASLFGAACLPDSGCAYKILIIPVAEKSHVFALTSIGEELRRRRHEVTMLLAESFSVSNDLASKRTGVALERYRLIESEELIDYDESIANFTKLYIEKTSSF